MIVLHLIHFSVNGDQTHEMVPIYLTRLWKTRIIQDIGYPTEAYSLKTDLDKIKKVNHLKSKTKEFKVKTGRSIYTNYKHKRTGRTLNIKI